MTPWTGDTVTGIDRTTARVRQVYYWSNIPVKVRKYVTACTVCQNTKAKDPALVALQSLPTPMGPNHRVHID